MWESIVFLETSRQHLKGAYVHTSRPVGRPICSFWEMGVPEWNMLEEDKQLWSEEPSFCCEPGDSEVDVFIRIVLCVVGQCREVKLQICLLISHTNNSVIPYRSLAPKSTDLPYWLALISSDIWKVTGPFYFELISEILPVPGLSFSSKTLQVQNWMKSLLLSLFLISTCWDYKSKS